MLKRVAAEEEHIVLQSVSPTMFEGFEEALGECHARITYDGHRLELRRLLGGVNPGNYGRFLGSLGSIHVRHSFDGCSLEMMSPRKDHDWIKGLLGRLIEHTATELNIAMQGICSTTLKQADLSQGLAPDEAYYIANQPRVHGKDRYEPEVDPPPDLVVEIEVTHSCIPRMPLLAKLGVPEVWKHADGEVTIYRLEAAEYRQVERSVSFPFLSGEVLTSFLEMRYDLNDTAITRKYLKWLRSNPEVPPPHREE